MRQSSERNKPKLARDTQCTACLACENICNNHAISHYVAEDGHMYVQVDNDKCIGCAKCEKVCEKSRSMYGSNDILLSRIFAAWSNKSDERARATSGGIFAALADAVISTGGCVIGAELRGFECRHTVVYDVASVDRLQGSKYMASSMEDVYNIISRELPDRDVLFTGLGCQCAGVLAFFDGFNTDHRLYTVDLVCGGVPSRILLQKYSEQNPEVTGIVSFRSKDKYELKVSTKTSIETVKEKSLPLHGFNCGMTDRYSCYACQYAKAHRLTDITIGDLWDYDIYREEHRAGISMVIVHSEQGQSLLEGSSAEIHSIKWKGALLHNFRTVMGNQNIYLPRKRLVEFSKIMQTERFFKLYTMTARPADIDLFMFRAYRYLKEKILRRRRNKEILEIVRIESAEGD